MKKKNDENTDKKNKQIRIQENNLEDENGRAYEEGYEPDEKVYCGNLGRGNCNGADEYSDDDDDDELMMMTRMMNIVMMVRMMIIVMMIDIAMMMNVVMMVMNIEKEMG